MCEGEMEKVFSPLRKELFDKIGRSGPLDCAIFWVCIQHYRHVPAARTPGHIPAVPLATTIDSHRATEPYRH